MTILQRFHWIVACVALSAISLGGVVMAGAPEQVGSAGRTPESEAAQVAAPQHVVLAWNDLGMHCYMGDFADLAVLPPYNTLYAQVVEVGDPPKIVSSGVTLSYAFPENTYSAGKPGFPDKTNFWTYAQQIFGLDEALPVDVGLTGKGLAGSMDSAGDHFVAEGIPLTEYRDQDALTRSRYPYQLAAIAVLDATTAATLTQTTAVAPVSTEMSCGDCHADGQPGSARISGTGKVETNVLALHDLVNRALYPSGHSTPLMERRPVLCAECHASNALAAPGVAGLPSLSNAVHGRHASLVSSDTAGCYKCHPGPETQCLRDVMSTPEQEGGEGMGCADCHGDMAQVAQNPEPWLQEPRCDSAACHPDVSSLNQPLYRMSQGHGRIYCAGCHDSPHAIAPSSEPNDSLKFMALQGGPGPLEECTVCHLTQPTAAFTHALPGFDLYLPLMGR